jgi:hypothetical protein
MRSVLMVVANIFGRQPLEMAFIQHDHVIEQISTAVRISTFLLWFSAFMVFVFIFFPRVIANLVADLLAGKS